MILLRTITVGFTFLKLIATRSNRPMPALDATDCTHSRR